MATINSNRYVFELHNANVDWGVDTFSIILMQSGYVFDPDLHDTYADVIASELAAGNGYLAGGSNLAGVTVTRDDANNRTDVTCDDVQWDASGGSIGPSPGAIVMKDTGTASTSIVVGYIDFSGDQTAPDGAPFIIRNIVVRGRLI